ncbi:hypothetical protein AKJ09_04152 [Labilithrix luteola]|uniref:DUF302 domain-containing protein n=1 Tax=Labilithrix luteola TaxID=1391654 RepID=A0A0K1PVC7_9BACT|nr:DUF302 domain-containing protein [Labilithrix luteola]AKU97488.1 hypothetical protein AKJ09_04152 [Labilithrix luteola]
MRGLAAVRMVVGQGAMSELGTAVSIDHVATDIPVAFDAFIVAFEGLLGHFDPSVLGRLKADPEDAKARIAQMEGEQGLMIFGKLDHGALFALSGQPKRVLRYHVGNPLIAFRMTQLDVRAALYAPLTVLLYELDQVTTRAEYDRPSTLFGQFQNEAVNVVARELDTKLAHVLEKASAQAQRELG